MEQNFEKFFSDIEPKEPSAQLFDSIIFAIKREQELRNSKKMLFGFSFLLLACLIATPISGLMLVNQIQSSGIYYFISMAISDLGAFVILWQDFGLAILESLPLAGIIAFTASMGLCIFTLRLFLYKKRLLLEYFTRNLTHNMGFI